MLVKWPSDYVDLLPRCTSCSPRRSQIDTVHSWSSANQEAEAATASCVRRGRHGDSRRNCERSQNNLTHFYFHLFMWLGRITITDATNLYFQRSIVFDFANKISPNPNHDTTMGMCKLRWFRKPTHDFLFLHFASKLNPLINSEF